MIPRSFLKFIPAVFGAALVFSCASSAQRLERPKSTAETRLEDVAAALEKDPARALHLCGAFESQYTDNLTASDLSRVAELRAKALAALEARFDEAQAKRAWPSALSLARSLTAAGSKKEIPAAAFMRRELARDLAKADRDVEAFLAYAAYASASEGLPESRDDLRDFLLRAFKSRQRRTVSYFVDRADKAGVEVPKEIREFSAGRDSPSEMIKGVATVLVDKGMKIEKGMGVPDRVLGSAFFIDRRGYLVTNYHVISSEVDPEYDGYSRAYIRMGDPSKPRFPIKVIGWDPIMDLALIKVDLEPGFVFSVLDEASLDPGEKVLAIGSPAGLESTVTAGIVSAAGRRFLQLGDVVQVDAAVNHGNSGGPVIDSDGRLAGVAFAGIEQFEGLNFAIPIDRLARTLPDLFAGGQVKRPWLGFSLFEGNLGIEEVYVAPDSPAMDHVIPDGRVISSLNGIPAKSIEGLQDVLFGHSPGELVSLSLKDGRNYLLQSALRSKKPLEAAASRDTRERLAAPLFGMVLAATSGGLFSSDYVIKRVLRGSVADEAGLSENDPVTITGFKLEKEAGVALLDLTVKKRRMGYLDSMMRLPAPLESSDTL